MSLEKIIVTAVVVFALCLAGYWIATRHFSEEARRERRRRRSNAPVVSKRKQPAIRLSSILPKKRKRR